MTTLKQKTQLLSFGEKVFVVSTLIGIVLAALTMTDFGKTREFHLFAGVVATALAIMNMFKIGSVTGPSGILVWSVLAVICYGVYAGFIPIFR